MYLTALYSIPCSSVQSMSYGKLGLVGNHVALFLGELDDRGAAGALVDVLEKLVHRGIFALRFPLDLEIRVSTALKLRRSSGGLDKYIVVGRVAAPAGKAICLRALARKVPGVFHEH